MIPIHIHYLLSYKRNKVHAGTVFLCTVPILRHIVRRLMSYIDDSLSEEMRMGMTMTTTTAMTTIMA